MDVVDSCVFFEAEDGIRDLVRSRGLGDVYKRQALVSSGPCIRALASEPGIFAAHGFIHRDRAARRLSLIHI